MYTAKPQPEITSGPITSEQRAAGLAAFMTLRGGVSKVHAARERVSRDEERRNNFNGEYYASLAERQEENPEEWESLSDELDM